MVNTIKKHIQMYMHYALVGRYKCILIDLINLRLLLHIHVSGTTLSESVIRLFMHVYMDK